MSGVGRIIKQDTLVRERDCRLKVFEASRIAPELILNRHIMSTLQYPCPDTNDVDIDALSSDIEEPCFVSQFSGSRQHPKIGPARERCLYGETDSTGQKGLSRSNYLFACFDVAQFGIRLGLQFHRNCIRIEYRRLLEKSLCPAGKSALAASIRTCNHRKGWRIQDALASCFRFCSSSSFCCHNRSTCTP
jgi:hypothetical protein